MLIWVKLLGLGYLGAVPMPWGCWELMNRQEVPGGYAYTRQPEQRYWTSINHHLLGPRSKFLSAALGFSGHTGALGRVVSYQQAWAEHKTL